MTKLQIAKIAATTIVGFGTSKIVQSICLNNTQPDNLPDKVMVHSAALVMGMMAADLTRRYTDAKIDEVANWWTTNVKKNA
jgi:hypothetical protein